VRSIAIFGLSGNPSHNGHVAGILAVSSSGIVDETIVVPCGGRPEPGKRGLVAANHRVAMTRIACNSLRRRPDAYGGVTVDASDAYNAEFTRTADLIEQMRRKYDAQDAHVVIGTDLLEARDEFHGLCEIEASWKDGMELFASASFLVLRREGGRGEDCVRLPVNALLIDDPIPEVSSTDIRELISRGQPVGHLVPPAVAEYIRDNGLYR